MAPKVMKKVILNVFLPFYFLSYPIKLYNQKKAKPMYVQLQIQQLSQEKSK